MSSALREEIIFESQGCLYDVFDAEGSGIQVLKRRNVSNENLEHTVEICLSPSRRLAPDVTRMMSMENICFF